MSTNLKYRPVNRIIKNGSICFPTVIWDNNS